MSAKKTTPAIMSKDDALKLCETIAKQGEYQDKRIQSAAVTAIGYSILHGDVTIAQRLIEVFPKGNKLASLVAFMEHFGNIAWNKDKGNVEYIKDDDREVPTTKDVSELLLECAAKQWHEYGPKSVPKSQYDVLEEVEALLKRLTKKVAKGEVEIKHAAAIEEFSATVAKVRAAEVQAAIDAANA